MRALTTRYPTVEPTHRPVAVAVVTAVVVSLGVTRNGAVGQAYNSTPYYCGTTAGATGSITYPVLTNAIAQLMTVDGKPIPLDVKEFKPNGDGTFGSLGWGYSGKINVTVGGIVLTVQASINLTVVNSKTQEG